MVASAALPFCWLHKGLPAELGLGGRALRPACVGCVPHQDSPAELEQERSSRRLLRLETDRPRGRRAAGLPEKPGVVGAADSRS